MAPKVKDLYNKLILWENMGNQFVKPNPMKRFGKPEEVGYLLAFLLSDQANFINATVILIDGWQSYGN